MITILILTLAVNILLAFDAYLISRESKRLNRKVTNEVL
jgi:hypothetical protein